MVTVAGRYCPALNKERLIKMELRLRFAPSPTGHVHIGNIRTAIFNWLHARHCGGKFLLRVEDTDKERSTEAAKDTLLECMRWLGLNWDEDIFYQSSREEAHRRAAEKLLPAKKAARGRPDNAGRSPIIFRIPWDSDTIPNVRVKGPSEIEVHPEVPVKISADGVAYAQISPKGKAMEQSASLAGFHGLKVFGKDGACLFDMEYEIGKILGENAEYVLENPAKLAFQRREVFFNDLVKGELAKPLENMKDLIIVRSDGTPVFHFANVCDDIEQRITHVIRGDDHVENTYRHIFLFNALGQPPPAYGHLPMIVNQAGKPYSKRDGDAYVGDFRSKGFLPEALFNYLALLGWSPGDDREKMSVDELVKAFALERVKSSSAQFDMNKLLNMNGLYMSEIEPAKFAIEAFKRVENQEWAAAADPALFAKVAILLQSRTKTYAAVEEWKYFFTDSYEMDEKAFAKNVARPEVSKAFQALAEALRISSPVCAHDFELLIRDAEKAAQMGEGKLNQPLRIALTGRTTGAGIYETMELLGREKCAERLAKAIIN